MPGAIGYARVSTDEQAKENNSLSVQTRKITTYCEQNGLTLLKVFEASESARTMSRDGLEHLLDYCRDHRKKITEVVVSDLSRLARNVENQAQIIVRLKTLGIKMVSIDEPLTDDSAMGAFVRNMLGSVNQLFSDSLSERTRYRMQAAVKSGRFLWPAPIGYLNKNKQLQLDSEHAPLVRESFELIASGRYVTTDAVLKVVTALGLRTKKGRPLSKQSFARMLSNPIYTGWVVSGEVRARGNHEQLISDELFHSVQMRLTGNSTPHKKLSEDFPLRGVVRCSKCGKTLTAGFAKGRKERYPRYWCWTTECREVGISRAELEGQFIQLLSRMQPTAELLLQLPERIAIQWKDRKERIATDARRLANRLERQAVDLEGAWEKDNINQRQELAKSIFPEGLVFRELR
jgi:site-specific DNA recombinase